MLGLERRQLTLDLEDRIVGMRAGEQTEHVRNSRQQLPAQLQGIDGIGETRLRRSLVMAATSI